MCTCTQDLRCQPRADTLRAYPVQITQDHAVRQLRRAGRGSANAGAKGSPGSRPPGWVGRIDEQLDHTASALRCARAAGCGPAIAIEMNAVDRVPLVDLPSGCDQWPEVDATRPALATDCGQGGIHLGGLRPVAAARRNAQEDHRRGWLRAFDRRDQGPVIPFLGAAGVISQGVVRADLDDDATGPRRQCHPRERRHLSDRRGVDAALRDRADDLAERPSFDVAVAQAAATKRARLSTRDTTSRILVRFVAGAR